MKTLLICHEDDALNRIALAGWLSSFSELTGIVSLVEVPSRMKKRVKMEIQRIGYLRFLDVLAFRVFYKLRLAKQDSAWEQRTLATLRTMYPLSDRIPVLRAATPNSQEAEAFIREHRPDLIIARCKTLLAERIFSIARVGTIVMHPGICPEYRNSHGCFWALANDDLGNVGMTLLKVDKGVDTGPVYGYFRIKYDEKNETHIVIQHRVVFDNLPAIQQSLEMIAAGAAPTIDTRGRKSHVWGQVWLTKYLAWKRKARNR